MGIRFDRATLFGVITVLLVAVLGAWCANAAAAVTPEVVRKVFDANVIFAMLAWGFIQTRVPFLKVIVNDAVGWINVVGYILGALIVPAAHAATLGFIPDTVGWVLAGAFGNASAAFALYEALGRPLLDKWLKLPKYDPKHPGGVKVG